MNFSVVPTARFKKEAKRLVKNFASLKQALMELSAVLETNPETGTPLGNNCYKIRLKIQSKGKGRSGGARVITCMVTKNPEVYLLTIYDKSEMDSVSDKMLLKIVESINR